MIIVSDFLFIVNKEEFTCIYLYTVSYYPVKTYVIGTH